MKIVLNLDQLELASWITNPSFLFTFHFYNQKRRRESSNTHENDKYSYNLEDNIGWEGEYIEKPWYIIDDKEILTSN